MDSRLAKLETERTGAPWLYVLTGPPDYEFDSTAFLRDLGHDPGPRDLVVYIQRFSGDCTAPQLGSATRLRR